MGLGRAAGSMAGWCYAVAMIFVVTSSAVSCAYYVVMVIGRFSTVASGPTASLAITVVVVLAAWWPSHRDIKLSTKIMLTAEVLSALLIVAIIAMGLAASHEWVDRSQLSLKGFGFGQLRLGFVLAFMTLAGFESAASLGEESTTAVRTLPRVMLSCILPVAVLFLLSIYAMTALSHSRSLALDQTDAPIDMIAQSIGHPVLGWLSSLGVATSCFGCALGAFNAGSRMLYSMARSGQIPGALAGIHLRNGTPYRALAALAVFAALVPCVMVAMGVSMADSMDYLMQIASFGFLGSYFAVAVAAPSFLAREGQLTVARICISAISIMVIGGVLFMSVIPAPAGPWKFLPYVFSAMIGCGMLLSSRRPNSRPLMDEGTANESGPAL
jgi:amino acid transporter